RPRGVRQSAQPAPRNTDVSSHQTLRRGGHIDRRHLRRRDRCGFSRSPPLGSRMSTRIYEWNRILCSGKHAVTKFEFRTFWSCLNVDLLGSFGMVSTPTPRPRKADNGIAYE